MSGPRPTHKPRDWLTQIWRRMKEAGVKPLDRLVLLAVMDTINPADGYAYGGLDYWARKTGLSRRFVWGCLERLARSGHVEIDRRGGGRRQGGGTRTLQVYVRILETVHTVHRSSDLGARTTQPRSIPTGGPEGFGDAFAKAFQQCTPSYSTVHARPRAAHGVPENGARRAYKSVAGIRSSESVGETVAVTAPHQKRSEKRAAKGRPRPPEALKSDTLKRIPAAELTTEQLEARKRTLRDQAEELRRREASGKR